MKSNAILFSEKKRVIKYTPADNEIRWEIDFDYNVYGISRIENHVFVSTLSNWGSAYTSLIDFETGEKLWTIDEAIYSIHIVEGLLIFINKKKFFNGIDIKTGTSKFSVKSPFKWTAAKIMMLNGKLFIYSSKKTYQLNLKNGELSESKLPNKLNPKEIGIVIDEFQININNLPTSGGGDALILTGDLGGGDFGGGDAGGGGGGE